MELKHGAEIRTGTAFGPLAKEKSAIDPKLAMALITIGTLAAADLNRPNSVILGFFKIVSVALQTPDVIR